LTDQVTLGFLASHRKTPSKKGIRLDPRTKLAAIAAMAVAVALAPNMICEAALMGLALVFGVVLGRWKSSAVTLVLYATIITASQFVPHMGGIALRTLFFSFFLLIRKVFACGLMAYATMATTPVNELMSALVKIGTPRSVTIPVAVVVRYLPAVREDWGFIKTAMRMRGISPTPLGLLRAPMRTIDCVYVPVLMNAGRVADELSMAAIARGIENPTRRTCYLHIAMGFADYVMLASAPGYLNQYVRLHTDPSDSSEVYTVDFYLTSRETTEQLRELYYAFDSAEILPESTPALEALLRLLEDNSEVVIELTAHADRIGSDSYNTTLSERRARAVLSYLTARGIAEGRLRSRGYGKSHPFVVTRRVAEEHPFLEVGQTLDEGFIATLPEEQQAVCDALNRRTELRVLPAREPSEDEGIGI